LREKGDFNNIRKRAAGAGGERSIVLDWENLIRRKAGREGLGGSPIEKYRRTMGEWQRKRVLGQREEK